MATQSFSKKNIALKKIMVFGTFDVVHLGHISFFKQAKKLAKNSILIVSIARDENVKKIKGNKPLHNQQTRMLAVRALGVADKVVLGGLTDHLPHIIKVRPDIIALGYDQQAYVKGLSAAFKRKNFVPLIVRLKPYRPKKFKSSLVKRRAV